MNFWSDLFTPETYEAFGRSGRTISGFRESQRTMADKVRPGDKLICYMVRMSRWIGVLEVVSGPFIDNTPIFYPEDDPFVVRFKVHSAVWLPLNQTVPIREPDVFSRLTFTRDVKPGGYWQGPIRRSLLKLNDEDGAFLGPEKGVRNLSLAVRGGGAWSSGPGGGRSASPRSRCQTGGRGRLSGAEPATPPQSAVD
jgi:hypothetical protein